MLTENDIAGIARRIVVACAPLAVGTFGSYALGHAGERSDLDLFIIKGSIRVGATARSFRGLLFDVLHPIDVFVFTAQEFEGAVYRDRSFAWVIAGQARMYHWSEDARRLVPSLVSRACASVPK